MSPSLLEVERQRYAERLMHGMGGNTQRLHDAFADTAREDFVGLPPWPLLGHDLGRTWSDDARDLYQDVLVGLDAERGINNGQPSLHARCLAACDPRLGDTVLHIGAGTGYYSAILAQLVGERGRVIAYEIEPDLAARAAANLKPWPQASVRAISGALPPLPACDVIYVNAGATHPLAAWLDALRDGARLIFPLTPDDGSGCMLLVTHLASRALCRARDDARVVHWLHGRTRSRSVGGAAPRVCVGLGRRGAFAASRRPPR